MKEKNKNSCVIYASKSSSQSGFHYDSLTNKARNLIDISLPMTEQSFVFKLALTCPKIETIDH